LTIAKPIEKFDYVSLPDYSYSGSNTDVKNGLVLQIDSTKATVLIKDYRDEFVEVDIKAHNYRIIGKGTIYHNINNYVGMNIMLITQIFIFVLCIVLCVALVESIKSIF
jgi:hypothetical protein